MSGPLVTVVVPTRNRAHLLRRLLKALAEQEFPDYEVVAVDDASEDETWALLESWQGERKTPVRVDSQSGSYVARNVGWRAASADLIAFTDDDCIPDTRWLSSLVESLSSRQIVAVQGKTLASPGEITPFTHQIQQTSAGPPYRTANILYRRDELERQGGFRDLPWYADNIFGLHARGAGAIAFAPDAVVHHPPRPREWRSRSAWLDRFRADEVYRRELRQLGEEALPVPGRLLPLLLWVLRPLLKQSLVHARFAVRHPREYAHGMAPMFKEKVAMLSAMREFWRPPSTEAREPLPPLSQDPLISVIVLTKDRPALLEQTLAALAAQSYAPREVIVADNGSGSALSTGEAGASRVIDVPGLSLGAARQAAVDLASGEVVAFTDDDCLPDRQWLCRVVRSFQVNPNWHGVQGRTEAGPGPLGWHTVEVSAPNSLFQTCNIAYRSEAVRRAGGFDTRFEAWFEDTALGARVLSHGPIGWEHAALVVHQAVPARPITVDRWRQILADERLLAKQYASFYRRTRAPFSLASIVLRLLLGSPAKTLIKAAPRAQDDPTGYICLAARLLRERLALLVVLWPTRR